MKRKIITFLRSKSICLDSSGMTKRMFAKLRLLRHFVPRNDNAEFLAMTMLISSQRHYPFPALCFKSSAPPVFLACPDFPEPKL